MVEASERYVVMVVVTGECEMVVTRVSILEPWRESLWLVALSALFEGW